MTTSTLTQHGAARTSGRSWKAIIRRIFEQMGKQYSHIPNML